MNYFKKKAKKLKEVPANKKILRVIFHLVVKLIYFLVLILLVLIDIGKNLHLYIHLLIQKKKNPYQEAIKAVGQIVQVYAGKEKHFYAYGYAAGVPETKGKVVEAFNLAGFLNQQSAPLDLSKPCVGIEQVLDAYKKAVPNLTFGDMGQVNKKSDGKPYKGDDFYQLIDIAIQNMGEIKQEDQKYSLLLLMVDGDYIDMKATTDAIVRAAKLPLSIVIVGVGNGDFLNCIKLDADDHKLVSSSGEKAVRDVVQFVKYNDHKGDIDSLAAKVLEELPSQFIEFMRQNNFNPNAKKRLQMMN